jgi:hypothetical protein
MKPLKERLAKMYNDRDLQRTLISQVSMDARWIIGKKLRNDIQDKIILFSLRTVNALVMQRRIGEV